MAVLTAALKDRRDVFREGYLRLGLRRRLPRKAGGQQQRTTRAPPDSASNAERTAPRPAVRSTGIMFLLKGRQAIIHRRCGLSNGGLHSGSMANLGRCAGLIGSFAIYLSVPLLAQPIPPVTIADKELGWIKVYDFKPTSEPLKVDTRVYPPLSATSPWIWRTGCRPATTPSAGWEMSCAPSLS